MRRQEAVFTVCFIHPTICKASHLDYFQDCDPFDIFNFPLIIGTGHGFELSVLHTGFSSFTLPKFCFTSKRNALISACTGLVKESLQLQPSL